MRVYQLTQATDNAHRDCVVTLGNFDGCHRGHAQLISRLVQKSKALGVSAVVITFHPYPSEYFQPNKPFIRLQRFSEKLAWFADRGVDTVVCLRFNAALAHLPAETFIQRFLHEQWRAYHVIVGDDFRFGARRAGDVRLLQSMGERLGFTVEQLSTFEYARERVSSTRIRAALVNSDLATAKQLLGRHYSITARVCHGDKRGREWGYPTVNLPLFRQHPPLKGVFAVAVVGEDFEAQGVASVGFRPVFELDQPLLEVFLLDFNREIYGQRLRVDFLMWLREETDFDSVTSLINQIEADVNSARDFFRLRKLS